MITGIVRSLAYVFTLLIFIYVLMSWLPNKTGKLQDVYRALETLCEWYLAPFRKLVPPIGGIDFSPIIAVVVLQLVVLLIDFIL